MTDEKPASTKKRNQSTRFKSFKKKLGLLCGAFALALFALEIGLRVFGISYPRVSQTDYYRGTARRPNAEWEQSREGNARIKLNSDGFRDKDRPSEKLPDTVRIAVLGDSYVDALQVSLNQRFTELLENELNSRSVFHGAKVEVMNFGVSGYGTAQELMVLRHCVWKYHPDIVLLAFLPGNDVRNNYEPLQGDPGRPYFILRDGELLLDDSFRTSSDYKKNWFEKLGYRIIDHSRLAQLAYNVRRKLQRRQESVQKSNRGKKYLNRESSLELGLDDVVFRPPEDKDWKTAWCVTEEIIKTMDFEVRQQGAKFVVVTLTTGTQVNPNPDVRKNYAQQLEVADLFYPGKRIKALGEQEGFPVINLSYPFLEYAEIHDVYLHGFSNTSKGKGHWNANGHWLAADIISTQIAELFGSSSRSGD